MGCTSPLGIRLHCTRQMRFTPAKRAKFLAALMGGQTVSAACKLADVPRSTAYDTKDSDAEFSRAWEDAIVFQGETLITEARKRALDSEDKHAHTLLMFLIKAAFPQYRDNYKTEHKVIHENVHEIELGWNDEDFDLARQMLDKKQKEARRVNEEAMEN